MTKLFAVHGGSSIFTVVKANVEEEAFNIFAENQIEDEIFREHIDQYTVNAGLFGKFYQDEEGYLFEEMSDQHPLRIRNMSEDERDNYINHHIELNVREFWHDAPQYANEYLMQLKAYELDWENHIPVFSKEFYMDTIKRVIKSGTWYEDFGILEIEMHDTNYLRIYEQR